MKVLIVGGGMAGLALGAFLEKEGIDYEIVEKQLNYSHHGYLISIWMNGRNVLYKLGLGQQFDEVATPVHTYSVRTARGDIVKEYNLRRFFPVGAVVFSIERATIHNWLRACVPNNKIFFGKTVLKLTEDQNGVTVEFSSGEKGQFDVVVGADGMNSAIRDLVFGKDLKSYQDWRIWYTWVDAKFDTPATITEYIDEESLISIFGTRDKTTAWFFSPTAHGEFDSPEGRKKRLTQLFEKKAPFVKEALQHLHDADFIPSDLIEIKLDTPARGRCVLIGDAAHGFGPYTGLGCSLAMEDAYVLAAELKSSVHTSIAESLSAYCQRRAPRIKAARQENVVLKMGAAIKNKIIRRGAIFVSKFVPQYIITARYRTFLKSEI